MTPWEVPALHVHVFVVGALGQLAIVLLENVLVVRVVLRLNLVHVGTQDNSARDQHIQTNLAPQLSRLAGVLKGVLALLDAYPADVWRAEPEPDAIAALRALLAIAGYDPEAYPQLRTRDAIVDFLRRGDSALGNLPAAVLDGVVRAVTDTNRLVRLHHHARFDGTLLHVRAGNDHVDRPQLQASLWAAHAADIESIELPFLHAELTGRDATARIAPMLDARLVAFDPM
mgnify:CR=1 FL=1